MFRLIAVAFALCSLTACGSALTPFATDQPQDGITGEARSLFEGCSFHLSKKGENWVQTRWNYCGSLETPDAYVYRKYEGLKAPGMMELVLELEANEYAPGTPKEHVSEERTMSGQAVTFAHYTLMTQVENFESPFKEAFVARTEDNAFFICVVDRAHAFEPNDDPRETAQAMCVKGIEAMVAGAR